MSAPALVTSSFVVDKAAAPLTLKLLRVTGRPRIECKENRDRLGIRRLFAEQPFQQVPLPLRALALDHNLVGSRAISIRSYRFAFAALCSRLVPVVHHPPVDILVRSKMILEIHESIPAPLRDIVVPHDILDIHTQLRLHDSVCYKGVRLARGALARIGRVVLLNEVDLGNHAHGSWVQLVEAFKEGGRCFRRDDVFGRGIVDIVVDHMATNSLAWPPKAVHHIGGHNDGERDNGFLGRRQLAAKEVGQFTVHGKSKRGNMICSSNKLYFEDGKYNMTKAGHRMKGLPSRSDGSALLTGVASVA